MKNTYFFCVWLLVLASCQRARDNYEILEGEWRNVSLHLVQHSVGNTLADSVLQIDEGLWDSLLHMRPIRTTFANNGTYISRYYNLQDSLIFDSAGQWHFIGDSLYLTADVGTTVYFFEMLGNDRARFVSKLDWDDDGLQDDFYDGVQQKY